MKCPYCNYEDTKVVDSRPVEDGLATRRRRECGKNIETTKHLGGFSILLYVCCSLHQFSVTMVNHCLYWVEDLVS